MIYENRPAGCKECSPLWETTMMNTDDYKSLLDEVRRDYKKRELMGRLCEIIGTTVVLSQFREPALGKFDDATTSVALVLTCRDHALASERADHPAQVARVQPELRPQRSDIGTVLADLVQQPRLRQGPAAPEKAFIEHADAPARAQAPAMIDSSQGWSGASNVSSVTARSASNAIDVARRLSASSVVRTKLACSIL